jgi:hypothetical protein
MSITIIISEIIQQLLKGSHSEDIFEEPDDKIVNLTPIVKVSEGASTELEPENSFYAEMELPKGLMPTLIVSKELYPMYLELPSDTFISRLNKTLFDYINEQLIRDRTRGVHDADNIWVRPTAAFVNWFHENGINIDLVPILIDNQTDDPIEKEDTNDALWTIADDMRQRKKEGEFKTFREAYRWAEKHMTQNGKQIIASKLERAFHKARSEGKV